VLDVRGINVLWIDSSMVLELCPLMPPHPVKINRGHNSGTIEESIHRTLMHLKGNLSY
jgi:hypothetical protein